MNLRYGALWSVVAIGCTGAVAGAQTTVPPKSPPPAKAPVKPSSGQPGAGKVPVSAKGDSTGTESKQLVAKLLDEVASNGKCAPAFRAMQLRRDQLIAFGDLSRVSGDFRELSRGIRLIQLLRAGDRAAVARRAKFMVEHPKFASELAFVMRFDADKPEAVLDVVDALAAKHADKMEEFAGLAAACCVVFDGPVDQQLNENKVTAAPPAEVFGFLASAAGRMVMDPRKTPVELLVYVVNVTSPINELSEVERRYRGDAALGKRYFDIDYDNDHFRRGTPKKVTVAGYSLPNIMKFGGVCIDQAYFSQEVGKTLGIPTVIVTGRGTDVSHAWLGFVERKGGGLSWEMKSGRYPGYLNVIGDINDPQVRQPVTEGELNVLASFASEPVDDRRVAAGLVDAVDRMQELAKAGKGYPPVVPEGAEPGEARTLDTQTQLRLLEDAARRCPGLAATWRRVSVMSEAGELDAASRKRWAEALVDWCATRYPDFACDNLVPLIKSVKELDQQDKLWDWAYKKFAAKPQLAARIKFANAEMWDKADRPDEAWKCYSEVISAYVNVGPEPISAADHALALLERHQRPLTGALTLIGEAWKKCDRPMQMAEDFATQSAWFQLGVRYATVLKKSNRAGDAAAVFKQLGVPEAAR